MAHRQLGNTKEAEREELLGRVALQGIFGTGNGSPEAPWHVLRISDQYDVLKVLGKRPARQEMVRREDHLCDRHICEDGSEVWFDLSLLFGEPQ